MIRICGWCNKPMGLKPPLDDKSTTTSICPECLKNQSNKIEASFTVNAYRSIAR